MEPYIDIWDVDLVDTLEPVVSLGRRKGKKSKKVRKKVIRVIYRSEGYNVLVLSNALLCNRDC